jgi:hypothetical protein
MKHNALAPKRIIRLNEALRGYIGSLNHMGKVARNQVRAAIIGAPPIQGHTRKAIAAGTAFEALAGGSIHFECDAAVGVALGVPTILAVSPALDHFLAPGWAVNFVYGTHPNDPRTIALSVLVLTGTAVLAGYVPARRASRVDPAIALRHE